MFIQTKLGHWNVRGTHFIGYHELFDELAGHLTDLTDTVAERVTALGGVAGVPVQSVASQTSLPVWPLHTSQDSSMIEELADHWSIVANSTREAIVTSADEDPVTRPLY